jgi:Glycosyltransferase
LSKIDPDIRGIFVGGAWNNATAYERQVRMYGREQCGDSIVFLGTRHDVPDLYPDFDVVVHPSHSENVGGAVESLLAGVPTIATNVGGFPDLIHHGETGWLVPPRDPARLAQTILTVLHAPEYARQVALQGQAYARKLFDVRATAQDIVQIYATVLSDVAVPAISIK